MVEPNLESLIKDLYNHARHDLSEDLVAALLETAKKLPTYKWAIAGSSSLRPGQSWLLLNPKHPAPELLNLARFIKREEAKYRGTAASALMYGDSLKCFDSIVDQSIFYMVEKQFLMRRRKKPSHSG